MNDQNLQFHQVQHLFDFLLFLSFTAQAWELARSDGIAHKVEYDGDQSEECDNEVSLPSRDHVKQSVDPDPSVFVSHHNNGVVERHEQSDHSNACFFGWILVMVQTQLHQKG